MRHSWHCAEQIWGPAVYFWEVNLGLWDTYAFWKEDFEPGYFSWRGNNCLFWAFSAPKCPKTFILCYFREHFGQLRFYCLRASGAGGEDPFEQQPFILGSIKFILFFWDGQGCWCLFNAFEIAKEKLFCFCPGIVVFLGREFEVQIWDAYVRKQAMQVIKHWPTLW